MKNGILFAIGVMLSAPAFAQGGTAKPDSAARPDTTTVIVNGVPQHGFNIGDDATSAEDTTAGKFPLVIEFSLFDLPFNSYGARMVEGGISTVNEAGSGTFANAISVASPEQATQITNGIATSAHWGISQINFFKEKAKNKAVQLILVGAFDIGLMFIPFGSGWVHEEGHRAIMATSYTYSYNPFAISPRSEDASGDGLSSVSYVLDTNLALMKARNNANFIRLSTMGGEMNIYSIGKMQQNTFFHAPKNIEAHPRPIDAFYYLLNLLNVSLYINTCSQKDDMTKKTLEQMAREGSNQKLRDFTGLDFAAWAYDLNHPDEPYANRGMNPYGNGYDRYIYGDKLTDEQYEWIGNQAILSYINLLSPFNIGWQSLSFSDDWSFNFSGRYYPTSFGSQTGIELYYKTSEYSFFLAPHINQNLTTTYFGLEAMMFEKAFSISGVEFLGTARTVLDMQPENQRFTASGADFTGLLGGRLSVKASQNLYPYVSVEGKTKGWIAGNPFLDENVSVRLGLSARFYQ